MKKKMKTGRQLPGINPLLKIAERIGAQARRADNRINWREKCLAILQDAEGKKEPDALLRTAQISRDAGHLDPDIALINITGAVEMLADKIIETDSELLDLSKKMTAIEKREGVEGDYFFNLDDPDTPDDYLALNVKYIHRLNQIHANILKAYGEDELADLQLNDPITLGHRHYAALCVLHKDDPKALAMLDKMDAKLKEVEAKKEQLAKVRAALAAHGKKPGPTRS